MSNAIVYKLIKKDVTINIKPIFAWFLVALLGISTAVYMPGILGYNIGFSLLITAIVGLGIHMMMHTIVLNKEKGTQIFIMTLPLTHKQMVAATLLVNLIVFYAMWFVISAACLYVAFSQSILPNGSLPILSIVLFSILPAYTIVLSACALSRSVGYTAVATVPSAIGTSAYIWWLVGLDSVGNFVWGDIATWNTTIFMVLGAQLLISITVPALTVALQLKKQDYL